MTRLATPVTPRIVGILTLAGLLLSCGGGYRPATNPQPCCTPVPVSHPLHVQGQWVVDAHNRRDKLAGVNCYGAEEQDNVVAGVGKVVFYIKTLKIKSSCWCSHSPSPLPPH